MSVRDDEDVSVGVRLWVFETPAVEFVSDICDDGVETTDDVFWGSVRWKR